MLDIHFIRKNPDAVSLGVKKKGAPDRLVGELLALDEEWRGAAARLDALRTEQNALTEKISGGRDEILIEKAKRLKEDIQRLGEQERVLEEKRDELLCTLPNIPFPDVPVGKDENENVVLREVGEKRTFDFPVNDYLSLAEEHGIIDVTKSAAVAGSRFGYLLGDAALLEFSLVRYAFDVLIPKGFIPILPPVMIKPEMYRGMGRLSGDQREERYFLERDELYLVGSSEHTIGPYHAGDVLGRETLPRRYVGFSTCFRREAGSHGKDTKGILRVHQFDKVEMFSFADPEKSEEEHLFLLSVQEELMRGLQIPYRVLLICTGDMGFTDARQYDIEAWLPGQGKYRETHSCSNTTDFQARGVNVRCLSKERKQEYAHMLNATACALGRMLIAIIENYQTKEGNIVVPEVLREYIGKDMMTKIKDKG